jgi:hypothetical protein
MLRRSSFAALALLGAVSLAGLGLVPGTAAAQSDADRATARELGLQGFAALDAHDYQTAEDRLKRADKLVHAPTLLLGLARALAGQRKFVEAQEAYQRIIREGLAPGAPEAFKNAIESAKSELGSVSPLLGGVTITVTAPGIPPGGEVPNEKVTIDGNPVNVASLGVRRAVDPGSHVLKVTADGYKPAEVKFSVPEGGSVDSPVTLEKDPNWVAPAVAPTGTTPGTVPTSQPTGPGYPPPPPPPGGEQPTGGVPSYLPWVGFGVGAAGLLLGGITGAVALGDHSTLSKNCQNGSCDSSQKSTLDGYHTMGALSTTGFIIGGVGVAAGVVFLLMQPSSGPAAQAAPATGLHVTPVIGLGSVGATGSF